MRAYRAAGVRVMGTWLAGLHNLWTVPLLQAKAYQQKMRKRPQGRTGCCGLFGKRVDLVR